MSYKLYCLACGEVYDMDLIGGDQDTCPKADCCGGLIQLDDLMVEPIKELNEKGYYTEFCCSGHTFEDAPAPYIRFYYIFPHNIDAPEGWYKDDDYTIRAIEIEDREYSPLEKYEYIVEKCLSLMKWVNKLKDVDNMDDFK